MKKFFFLTTIATAIFLTVCFNNYDNLSSYVCAEETSSYKRVVTTDTPFYLDQNKTQILFYLPYTYFVKVLEDLGELTHVECYGNSLPKIDGYVPTNSLLEWKTTPQDPYPNVTLTTAKACNLYQDNTLTKSTRLIFANRALSFVGVFYQNGQENVYMVYYNQTIGFVKESDLLPFEMPLHPEPMPSGEKEEGVENSTPNFTSNTLLRYAVIGCLLLAGIIALFFSLRKKNTTTTTFDGEADYE